jgi:uncharacterized membrane protein
MTGKHHPKKKEIDNEPKGFKLPFEGSIPEEVRSIIEDPEISDVKKNLIVGAFIKSSSFIGPIPPPDLLGGYNDVVKDGAERIFAMAEKQSSHRIQIEDQVIKEELKQSRLGQLFGFILGLVGMALATTLALFGHEAVAGIFGTTTIIGLVTVFVLGKKSQQKNNTDNE